MDPDTPIEETMGALASAVQSGKAIYVGLSNYDGETLKKATGNSEGSALSVCHQSEPLFYF